MSLLRCVGRQLNVSLRVRRDCTHGAVKFCTVRKGPESETIKNLMLAPSVRSTQPLAIETKSSAVEIQPPAAETQPPALRKRGKRPFERVLINTNDLIEELSHMDEVRKAQEKVIRLKDNLIESGTQKRNILAELSEIRRNLKRTHRDITDIGRGSERYITLIREEIVLLRAEERIQSDYDQADDVERNLFTQLTAAINDSYEKEKIHASTLRMWGLIATLITSAITLILSTIGHWYHTAQLGLVGSKFSNTEKISDEVRALRDILVQLRDRKPTEGARPPSESWGGYFSRHISSVYRYFVPKKT